MLGLATLFAPQAGFGLARRHPRAGAVLDTPPLLLLAESRVLAGKLRAAHGRGRAAGAARLVSVRRYEDVAGAILERNGSVSVLRRGETISLDLLADVRRRHAAGLRSIDLLTDRWTTP